MYGNGVVVILRMQVMAWRWRKVMNEVNAVHACFLLLNSAQENKLEIDEDSGSRRKQISL